MKRQYALNPLIDDIYKSTLYQPQQQNHFELQIKLPRDLRGGTNENQIEKIQRYLNLAVTNFSLPTITTTPINLQYGNTQVNIAGKTEFGGADSITCIDYIGADIERIIYNWQMMVTNPETGQQGWAYNYKVDGVVIEYAPDGSCLSTWVLRGLWPSAVNYGTLDKGSGDLKSIEVTLSYDIAYKKFEDNGRQYADTDKFDAKNDQNAANMAAKNMTWKAPDEYESFYGEDSGLNDDTTPGKLGAASQNDNLG